MTRSQTRLAMILALQRKAGGGMMAVRKMTVHHLATLKTFLTDKCHVDHIRLLRAGKNSTRSSKEKVRRRNNLRRLAAQANKNVRWYPLQSSIHGSNHTLTSFPWRVLPNRYQDMVATV